VAWRVAKTGGVAFVAYGVLAVAMAGGGNGVCGVAW